MAYWQRVHYLVLCAELNINFFPTDDQGRGTSEIGFLYPF